MTSTELLQAKLVGPRFESHELPLEILKDFAAFEEMVIEVAKWKILQDHTDRRRAPRGFTQAIELRLSGLAPGSAVASISLVTSASGLPPLTLQSYVQQALEAIAKAIAAAEQSLPVSSYLPESLLSYFDRFGRGLRDGESIELPVSETSSTARLTKETRRRLLAATSARQITEETLVRGLVPEADQDNESFEIQTADGRKIKAPLQPQHSSTILDAFSGFRKGTRLLIHGVGRFSRQGKLEAMESIEHAVCLDPLDIGARLEELKQLKNGWLDGKLGKAPNPASLDRLEAAFDLHYPDDLVLPFLYPTAEGGVQAEWTVRSIEATLDIDLNRMAGDWHSLDLSQDIEQSRELLLDQPGEWQWLAEQIRSWGGVA